MSRPKGEMFVGPPEGGFLHDREARKMQTQRETTEVLKSLGILREEPAMSDVRLEAPCVWCGYSGENYWQAGTHEKVCPVYSIGGQEAR